MFKSLVFSFLVFLFSLQSFAAVLHFYSNPRVPQPLFHVTLEYKSYVYEADTRQGGRRVPAHHLPAGHIRVEIPDEMVDEAALQSQMGLPFDFNFVWDNQKTYCSKLVGIALNMEPLPMSFAGTHYVQRYPDWIHRNDPGISPDQILEFGLQHGQQIYPQP